MEKTLNFEKQVVFEHLVENNTGRHKKANRCELSNELNISPRRLRKCISEINSDMEIEKIISSKGGIYVCNTREECIGAIINTYKTAISLFKKANAMKKKLNLQGQIKIPLDNDSKLDFVEVFDE